MYICIGHWYHHRDGSACGKALQETPGSQWRQLQVHFAVNQCLSPGTITMFFRRYIVCCRTHTFIIQLTTTHMSPDEHSIFLEIVVASSKQWQNSQTFHGLLGATDQTVWHFLMSSKALINLCRNDVFCIQCCLGFFAPYMTLSNLRICSCEKRIISSLRQQPKIHGDIW